MAPTSSAHELRGVHGWLRFWVVVRIYLDPVVTPIQLALAWVGYQSLAEKHENGIIIGGLIDTVGTVALTVTGVLVGIALRDIKPRAVQWTKRWMLVVLIWSLISLIVSRMLGLQAAVSDIQALSGVLTTLASFAIWYSYFCLSERVRATYPDWADK